MRFGVCTSINNIKICEQAGFDYIEPALNSLALIDDDEFNEYSKLVDKSTIKCEVFNCFFPRQIKVVGKKFDEIKIKEYLEIAYPRVKRLGGKIIVFGSGGSRGVPEGFSFDTAWEQLSKSAAMAGDMASEYSIEIVMEPLNVKECNLLTSVKSGAEFVRKVNNNNVFLLADYYHMSIDDEPMDNILSGEGILKHTHLSDDSPQRNYPIDASKDEYKKFFENLNKIGYKGRLSLEGNFLDDINYLKTALKTIKEFSEI